MNSKLIGLIVDDSININHLIWTLYYLNGQSHYYYHGFDYWFDVADDPVDRTMQTDACIIEVEFDGSGSIEEFTEQVTSLKKASDHDGLRIITTRLHADNSLNTEVVDLMRSECDKVMVISTFGEPTLYRNKLYKEREFILDDFMETYFSDSKTNWEDVINTPWDRREHIGVNFRPFMDLNPEEAYDLSTLDHKKITYSDIYENLDSSIREIFEFIGNEIDEARYDNWIAIYEEWKQSVYDVVIWNRDFKKIIKGIVAGVDYDISRYQIDILREAAILNELLYKHNLSIKGYGLEALPPNTKEIHDLLEPNFHTLADY